ncbi:hypothetical protein ANN_10348 [Periplaneta americana]|uniref:DUF4817 domain-containing protein n=1 Tax=Periplaneta americana TaxID=6978 RepID=A0ABQ8TNR2_PERAM|nr:hypothetical protein ANN_10348 [Periplaneta americana]
MYGKADGNAALARRLYQERYPHRQCPDRKTFVRLHYRLCEYGKFNSPGLGRGRPRSTTPEVQEEILEAVNMTPSISTRRVALQVNVPHTTVWRLLKEYQLYPYHLQRVQALSPADYPARVRFCQWFLQQCGVNPNFPALVLFTDLAQFTRDGITNFHNQHVWAYENPRATVPSHHQVRFSLDMSMRSVFKQEVDILNIFCNDNDLRKEKRSGIPVEMVTRMTMMMIMMMDDDDIHILYLSEDVPFRSYVTSSSVSLEPLVILTLRCAFVDVVIAFSFNYSDATIERIPNLTDEQSDGITVFRIPAMTSLMLHRLGQKLIAIFATLGIILLMLIVFWCIRTALKARMPQYREMHVGLFQTVVIPQSRVTRQSSTTAQTEGQTVQQTRDLPPSYSTVMQNPEIYLVYAPQYPTVTENQLRYESAPPYSTTDNTNLGYYDIVYNNIIFQGPLDVVITKFYCIPISRLVGY